MTRAGFDGDAPLPFQIHVVEELLLHLPRFDRVGQFQKTVGEGRFAMVDMGNDGKIADSLEVVLEHDLEC